MAITTSCARTPVPTIVLDCYKSMLGYMATGNIQLQLLKHLETVEPSLICAALEYTAQCAPRPSWAYANATITRQAAMGSRTAEDFNNACAAFRAQQKNTYRPGFYRHSGKPVLAQQYSQRDYDQREIDLRQQIEDARDMAETGVITAEEAAQHIADAKEKLAALGIVY